jgi:hypothetical protein
MAEKNQSTKTLLTAKDLAAMGDEGEFCELVDGELVRMSPMDLRVFTRADIESGEDVIPGFSCPVAELFA